jgi:WD40 repeat protein
MSSSAGLIATGCEDSLRLWSSETGEELRKFTSPKRWKFCALSPDASRLMGCSDDGPLTVFDTKTGSTTAEIETGHSYGFKWLNNDRVLTAHHERFLSWDTDTTEWLVISQEATNTYVNDFSISPDGRSVLLATDSGLALRDLSTGSLLKSIHHEGNRFVYCIWLTNERIAARVDRLPVCIWNALDGSFIRQLTSDAPGRARAMCPDGVRLATTSGSHLEIWDTETGALLCRVKAHTHIIAACAWSADGTQVVTGSWDSTARVWEAESLRTQRDSTRHKREVNYVAISPDSRTVASGADDGSVIFWNVESGEAKSGTHSGPITGLGFQNSDRVYSTAAETPSSIQVWNALSGVDLEWFMLPTHTLASEFSRNGQWMACLGADYVLRIIDTQLQKFTDQIAGIGGPLETSLCRFSGNDRRLLSVAPRNRLWVFDVDEHRQCFRTADWIDSREGFSLASCLRDASFSPDGSRVVAPAAGGDLQVYDAATGRETLRLTARGCDVWTVDWSPDGRLIAASGDERVITIWEAETGLLWSRLNRHTHRVNDCAFSPCSNRLASVSLLDQQTFIWDVNNGSVLAVFQGVAGKKVVWSRDGLFIAVGGDEGLVAILGLEGF